MYRTMDMAVPLDNGCKCGRNYRLIEKVLGRKQEFFVDRTGGLITFIYADVPLWGVKEKVNAYQYIQYEPGKVVLDVEPEVPLNMTDIEGIKKAFRRIYSRFDIQIELVESIPRTRSGKFRYLIQKMPIELGNFSSTQTLDQA